MLTSMNEVETFTPSIPLDLIIEILSRLPAKSIARFRCLSKTCAFTLRNPDFTKSFFTISSSRPKLLFTCQKDGETFFFSSPHPQTSSPISVTIHMSYSVVKIGGPVRGLVCGLRKTTVNVPLICNPSTGQSLSLPSVPKKGRYVDWVINYLGYDPIDNQFKILCIWCLPLYLRRPDPHPVCHQVLTLRTGKKPLWKMIKCDIRHHRPYKMAIHNICINGVLYYLAVVYDGSHSYGIVSFDVRSEKFSNIKQPDQFMEWDFGRELESSLVNYKGKLATLHPYVVDGLERTRIVTGIQLWVLEDAGKHEWSRFIYILPPPLMNVIEETKLQFVGTTDAGEIVMSPDTISDSFFLIYYNPGKNTITKVEIRGMEAFKRHKACTFLDHVEDVNLDLVSNL